MDGGGGQRRSRRYGRYHRTYQPVSDMNVTPLVDVMLVLLIVFMISAPLLTVGIQVELPKTKAAQLGAKTEPLVLTITEKNQLYIQETPVRYKSLMGKLNAMTKANRDTTIYIRADRNIAYGQVMNIMGLISEGGYTKVSLVSGVDSA